MKLTIILNAVLYNRGSEALIRGLTEACKQTFDDVKITLISSEPNFEKEFQLDTVDKMVNKFSRLGSLRLTKFILRVMVKLGLFKDTALIIKYKRLIKEVNSSQLVIVIGADNYDKSYSMTNLLYECNYILHKKTKTPMMLYDCSLEKSHFTKRVIEDMKQFEVITVREKESFGNFKDMLPECKIQYIPDPAFLMKPATVNLSFLKEDKKYVGLNLSTLVLNGNYGISENDAIASFHELIDVILVKTTYDICFIPHVMNNADLSVLRKIYEAYITNDRVVLIDNEAYHAAELKYIIKHFDLFIGARTHATIAAYASCVPTLVLGYSIKSRGIALDLFGEVNHYVLPVDKLQGTRLVEGFQWLHEHKKVIRDHLLTVIPDYQLQSAKITDVISSVGMLE